jgi:selenide,water dikinase
LADGIESTLAPDNRHIESRLGISAASWDRHRFQLLFDPQTSGGMLISVNPRDAENVLRELHSAGFPHASAIGEVTIRGSNSPHTIEIVG